MLVTSGLLSVNQRSATRNLKNTRSFGKNYSPSFPRYDTDRIENDASNNSSLPRERVTDTFRIENNASNNCSIVAFAFDIEVTFLPSRRLATYTYRHTDRREGLMKQALEMDSGAMMYTPGFIKIGSGIQ
jgi:hypothetical protein